MILRARYAVRCSKNHTKHSTTHVARAVCSKWTNSPGVHILWIRPHKITEGPLVWNLLVAFDGADLVQSLDVRWKPTMDTQDLLIYQLGLEIKRCQSQAVWDKKDRFDIICQWKTKNKQKKLMNEETYTPNIRVRVSYLMEYTKWRFANLTLFCH